MPLNPNKAKAATKKAIVRKFTPEVKALTYKSRKNEAGQRSNEKNARVPEHKDHDVLTNEPSVNPYARKFELTSNGEITDRRMTRKEELNQVFKDAAVGGGRTVVIRRDNKGLKIKA